MSTLVMAVKGGGTTITIDHPQFGYTAEIIMPLHITRKANGKYASWDDGEDAETFDIYKFRGNFFLSAADMNELDDLIKNTTSGRAAELTLTLGAGSGFFPFGPTKGDGGTFDIFVTDYIPKGTVGHPAAYFNAEMEWTAQAFPAYSPPADSGTGPLEIGNAAGVSQVDNIRFPQNYTDLEYVPNFDIALTADGTGKAADYGESGDIHNITIPLTLQHPKAQTLLNHIISTVRANDFSVIAPANSYMFGRDLGDSGTYKVNLIDGIIAVLHSEAQVFDFNLSVNYIETL
jgi:hypothetical protein